MVNNPIKNPTSVYICVCARVRGYVNARILWRVPRDFTFSAATVDKFGQRSPIHIRTDVVRLVISRVISFWIVYRGIQVAYIHIISTKYIYYTYSTTQVYRLYKGSGTIITLKKLLPTVVFFVNWTRVKYILTQTRMYI